MKPSPAVAFLGPATCVVLLLLVAPLGLLARYSLNRYDPTELMIEAVTPANYLRFFTEAFYWDVMRTTILVAVLVTCLCLLLGLPMAYRLARTTSRWKSAMMLLVVLPLFIGSTVRTVGWMILFAQRGVMDTAASLFGSRIDLMYTPTAVVIGTLSVNLPFMVLTLQSVF
jgi:putative spermidine/putrescine transport system permease protein